MKKSLMIAMIVLVALVAVQGTLLAKSVKGTVEKADVVAKKLDVATIAGASAVKFDDKTMWPMGVTDPKALEGKLVNITVDDITDVATSVKEVVKPVAPDAVPAVVPMEAPKAMEAALPAEKVAEDKKMM